MSDVNLPKGWLLTKFTEVLDVQGGTQPPKAQFINEPHAGYLRLLQIRDFGAKPVPTFIPDTSKLKKCDINDILIGRYGASLGRICTGMEGAYNVALAKVISGDYLYKPFLKAYLESEMFQQPLALLSRSAQNGFNKDDLATFGFALIPLAEQKVIADKLDTLLAQIKTTKARLDRIPQILKTFRQSVLAAAVSGKLTEEWRGKNKSVNDVCLIGFDGPFGSKLKSADYTASGVRVARLENLGHLNFIDTKKTYISEEKHSLLLKNTLEIGDVLFSSFVDEEVKVCTFENSEELFINKADCFCLRPNTSQVTSQYLSYVLASTTSYKQIKDQVQGVTRPRINLKILKALIFEFPSIEQQTEIVRRVEELFAFADSIEQKTNAALEGVNNLTQSILAKAFRGELTADWRAQNPELISGDNSAEALLEQIKAEREALASKKKPIKKTRAKKKV